MVQCLLDRLADVLVPGDHPRERGGEGGGRGRGRGGGEAEAAPTTTEVVVAQARALASVYGLMIYDGRAHVALADLTVGQVEALTAALGTQ